MDIDKPIKLTKSILKRNGYKRRKVVADLYEWVSEDGQVTLSDDWRMRNTSEAWSVHVDTDDFRTIGCIEVTYVHELQQFLRLCKTGHKIRIYKNKQENEENNNL